MKDLNTIKNIVISETGVDITSKKRDHQTVIHRWLYFKLASETTNHSLNKIGSVVNKDHATVIHGLKQFNIETRWDKDLQAKYDQLSIICLQKFKIKNLEDVTKRIQFVHDELTRLYELKKKIMSNEFTNTK